MKTIIPVSVLLILLNAASLIASDGRKNKNNNISKSLTQITGTFLDINNISTYFYNNGIGDHDPSGNSGLVFPKGSQKTACYTSGLLWGGLIDGIPKVGGTEYRSGLQPGAILSNGHADDPTLDRYRIYRVRPDVKPGGPVVDLKNDAANEGSTSEALRAQYELDWNQWPASLGAPFTDVNGNGIYEPNIDIPGVPGADQTIWFVANDMDSTKTVNLFGAPPMGIEVQVTFWAYSKPGALGNMYFRKYRLINKGYQHNTVDKMYISMWADVDLGDAEDDFVGIDSVLNLQYSYNARPVDLVYNPLPPPCIGFEFLQGPLVQGISGQDLNKNGIDDAIDYGMYNGRKVGPGFINRAMNAGFYLIKDGTEPRVGVLLGSAQYYNYFQGKYYDGSAVIDPITDKITTYAVNGDPVSKHGWLDGLLFVQGERRQGSATGPFTFAPGDTQEVVLAEILAGATPDVDYISAVSLCKYYDLIAKSTFYNSFNFPVLPPVPNTITAGLDKQIVLDWGENLDSVSYVENFSHNGYTFQGYNVYQLPSDTADISMGKRLATFDIIDGVTRIFDDYFDPAYGIVINIPKQFGSDTGIKRYINLTSDRLNEDSPLVNGNTYYFAVTSYCYNPGPGASPNNLESQVKIYSVTPHFVLPGSIPTRNVQNIIHTGIADGIVSVNVVDPAKIINHPYQIFFTTRPEVRNSNGDWVAAGIRKINTGMHPDTLTGSSIDMAAIYGTQTGFIDLKFTLNVVSSDFDFADGIKLIFPPNVNIISAAKIVSKNNGSLIAPNTTGNTISYGDTTHIYTKNGVFAGDETWDIIVSGTIPITVDWKLFDDGYSGGPLDASGTTTVTAIGSLSRVAKYWNVKDSLTQQIKVVNQSINHGVELYPRRDDIITNAGFDASPIIDGFQVGVNVNYNSPVGFSKTILTPANSPTVLTHISATTTLDIQNYTIYAGTISSKAIDNFGFGTNDVKQLEKDYYLNFTGVLDTTSLLPGHIGQLVHFVKSGGSLATCFSATSLATHPLNPHPGTNAPFLMRVPFEVWSKDDHRQVNLMFRDRSQTETDNPFWAWNPTNRMYAVIVNSVYDTVHAIPRTPDPLNALATWVLVFYGTHYTLGDQVEVVYPNPVQFGVDKFTFTPTNVAGANPVPEKYSLAQNFPNPFNPSTTIIYSLPEAGQVSIKIYDILGREVRNLVNEYKTSGSYYTIFNAHGLSSGVYIYRLTAGNYSAVKKLLLLK
jgi:hypothetical protein